MGATLSICTILVLPSGLMCSIWLSSVTMNVTFGHMALNFSLGISYVYDWFFFFIVCLLLEYEPALLEVWLGLYLYILRSKFFFFFIKLLSLDNPKDLVTYQEMDDSKVFWGRTWMNLWQKCIFNKARILAVWTRTQWTSRTNRILLHFFWTLPSNILIQRWRYNSNP